MNELIPRIALFIAFVTVIVVQYNKIALLETEKAACLTQVETFKLDSKQELERFNRAHENADNQLKLLEQKDEMLIAEKVPKECNAAIQWGIKKSHEFL